MRTLRFVRSLILMPLLVTALALMAVPASAWARPSVAIGISVGYAPPPLPVYVQPVCPAEGYIWTPGYWAWDPDYGYYWVPGTWVLAPEVGFLWTPGYWGWYDSVYVWHPGYWGPEVGFYGGIDYGFGYTGAGFWGGYWNNGSFYYNRSVTNVNITNIQTVYSRPVVNDVGVTRASFNGGSGGQGGITRQATPTELAAAREAHRPPTATQTAHERAARSDRSQWASVNHGVPAIAATPRPGALHGRGVVTATNRPTFHALANALAKAPAHAARPAAGNGPAGSRRGNGTIARTQNRSANPRSPLTASRPDRGAPPRTFAHAAPAPHREVARPPRTMGPCCARPAPRDRTASAARGTCCASATPSSTAAS